jgi:SNF2 family DNA or RNA helicase
MAAGSPLDLDELGLQAYVRKPSSSTPKPYAPAREMTFTLDLSTLSTAQTRGATLPKPMPGIRKVVWKFDGISNPEELHHRLQYFLLRRTKADVKMELPPKTRQIINIDIPTKHRIAFRAELFKNKAALRKALDLSADGVIKPTIEMIINDLEEGVNGIAFTHRKLVAEHIIDEVNAKGFPCGFIHSGVAQTKRDALIKRARAAPGAFLIAATIDSTSTGIDLSHASTATVVELPYAWQTLAQAEGRLHRFRQEKSVLIRYMIGKGSSAELVLAALLKKVENFEKIIGPTGDRMLEELDSSAKGEDALDELYEAMVKQEAENEKARVAYKAKQKTKKAV